MPDGKFMNVIVPKELALYVSQATSPKMNRLGDYAQNISGNGHRRKRQ